MEKSILIIYSILISFLFISCSSKEKQIKAIDLYHNFYDMNKDNNFERLFSLDILGIRDKVEFNYTTNKYIYIPSCIGIKDSLDRMLTCLPSFPRNANLDEIRIYYNRIGNSDSIYLLNKYKNEINSTLFNNYILEIKSIYSEYYKIKVPAMLSQENIKTKGYNSFIVFYLYENKDHNLLYRCYYLRDSTSFHNNKINLKDMVKINSNWYHDKIINEELRLYQ